MFAADLKKNFIYDLIHNRVDQVSNVHQDSNFQFYNVEEIWNLIDKMEENKISLLNVATEPVSAKEIADIFNVVLSGSENKIEYRMGSKHFKSFNGKNGFLQDKTHVLSAISNLRKSN